jgi:serine phosphatase RsbU (regulator of sigma subunit)
MAFFDIAPCSDGRVALVVGEAISGYQFTASYMTHVRSILQVLVRLGLEPDASLAASHEFVLRNRPDGCRHLCVFLGLADPSTGSMSYAYAGGDTAMLLTTDGEIRPLAPTGPIMGISPDTKYGIVDLNRLDAGEVVLVFTNRMDEFWDDDATLAASLRRHASRCSDAASILAGLLADSDVNHPERRWEEFVAMAVRVSE